LEHFKQVDFFDDLSVVQTNFGYKPVIVIQINDNCLHTCLSYFWTKENTIARDNEYTSETHVSSDTCFDAHLFRRLFCLNHVMLCACSDDVIACFFVCK